VARSEPTSRLWSLEARFPSRRTAGRAGRLAGAGRSVLAALCVAAAACASGCEAPRQEAASSSAPGPVAETPLPLRAPRDAASGQPGGASQQALTASPLARRLADALDEDPDAYGVVVEQVTTGERLTHNPRRVFPAGSVYKLPVAYEVLRLADARLLSLDDRIVITPDDAVEPEPEGGLADDEEVTVREALDAMMSVSSNSAARALLRRIGRPQFNASVAALGLHDTRVPLDENQVAVTSAADMALMLRLLARDQLLEPSSRRELRRLLMLPKEPDPLARALPYGTEVLSKTGNLERASNVAALVSTARGPIIITVLDDAVDPGDARKTIADIASAAHEAYGR
jgi:beta-lactamase class A